MIPPVPRLLYQKVEGEKKLTYDERSRVTEVEHGSFTPLVFSSAFGAWWHGPIVEAAMITKRLERRLATKEERRLSYSRGTTMCNALQSIQKRLIS